MMNMNEYLTTTPALKGRVKQRYSDFIVEEVLEDGYVCKAQRFNKSWEEREERQMKVPERKEEEHLLLDMEKINTDSSAAMAIISRGLNVSKKRIGYAGLKDKRAITCQRISIYMPDPVLVERFGVKGIEIRNPVWSNKRVELGELKGNQFTITIREIAQSEEEIRRIVEEFGKQAEKGLPNFYGNQRFGGKRQITHRVGKLLLLGKFEEAVMLYLTDTYEEEKEEIKQARINLAKTKDYKKALREFPMETRAEKAMLNHLVKFPNDFAGAFTELPEKMRYLFTHAVQSDIFNKILAKRIAKYGNKALENIDGDVIINGVPAIILPGFESVYAEGEAGELEQEAMQKEELTLANFKTNKLSELSSKGERKEIVLCAQNFKLEKIEDDIFNEGKKVLVVSFFLSKGNYATTVLRELLKEEVF
ncbi:putative tRNA pseudouridine synthase D [uncultured archaeon]|nr:putative tRNA pseudouridine synthase D [uncultured archaeon]